jgi:uncharacterized membrane protein YhhN
MLFMFKTYLWAAVFAGISLIAAAAMVLSRGTDLAYPLTASASCAFVLTGLAGGAHRHDYGRCMILGLTLCALGDLVGVYSFFLGALCFLLAHLAFITAFLRINAWKNINVKITWVIILTGTLVNMWLLPNVPYIEWGLVIPYILILSAMVILASGVVPLRVTQFSTLGAAIFYVSDIFVARWHYVSPSQINAFFCYPLYYTACVLLAFSIAAYDLTSRNVQS